MTGYATNHPDSTVERTTSEDYVVCDTCGPLIGVKVDWDYVDRGGGCLKCIVNGKPYGLKRVTDEKSVNQKEK